MPEILACNDGRDVLLSFNEGVGLLEEQWGRCAVCSHDITDFNLSKVSQIIQKELFQITFKFDGTLNTHANIMSVFLIHLLLLSA